MKKAQGYRKNISWELKRNQERKLSQRTREQTIFKELNVIRATRNKIRSEKGQLARTVSRS